MSKVIVTVWKCTEHGEQELLDYDMAVAYCPVCGKQMEKIDTYEEGSA